MKNSSYESFTESTTPFNNKKDHIPNLPDLLSHNITYMLSDSPKPM